MLCKCKPQNMLSEKGNKKTWAFTHSRSTLASTLLFELKDLKD